MRTLIFILLLTAGVFGKAQQSSTQNLAMSAIQGTESKLDTLTFKIASKKAIVEISGKGANNFVLKSSKKETKQIVLAFAPIMGFIGLTEANLTIKDKKGMILKNVALKGLSTKALEGKNEPSLDLVLQALDYNTTIGWSSLGNHIKKDLQGDELPPSLFRKSGDENVQMIPVARYSPPFKLPYGYFINTNEKPVLHQIAVLSDSENYDEHQTLYPRISEGSRSFDPGSSIFGFYTTSPSHTAYSEDMWNKELHPDKAQHAVRIYPLKDSDGVPLSNTYLVCFEEASNGDYQDYVYLVKNISPVVE